MVLVVSVMLASFQLPAQTQGKAREKESPMEHPTFYCTIQIDGLLLNNKESRILSSNCLPSTILL